MLQQQTLKQKLMLHRLFLRTAISISLSTTLVSTSTTAAFTSTSYQHQRSNQYQYSTSEQALLRSRISSFHNNKNEDKNNNLKMSTMRLGSTTSSENIDTKNNKTNTEKTNYSNNSFTTKTKEQTIAKRVSSAPSSLKACGERLRNGDLVSFPTETVYGLGCHALDPDAVHKVFAAKRRPLTDPLIVHVISAADACQLWNNDSSNDEGKQLQKALMALMDQFWPGPLTIIAQAHECVPPIVTAGTGFVAARCPSHPIARELIRTAGIPIAAPSANRFGHVSPTRANHVLSDLGAENVWVVDPDYFDLHEHEHDHEYSDSSSSRPTGICNTICNVGVESTVAKVDEVEGTVSILRHGAVSPVDIQNCLKSAELANIFRVQICIRTTGEEVANVAPGQTIKHYSPDVPSFIISQKRLQEDFVSLRNDEEKELVQKAVVLDFEGQLSWLQNDCLAYRDLSASGDSNEAAMRVFDSLRWSELIEGAERVYFPELVVEGESDALALAVKDRLTRAASGVVIDEFQ